ncbi:unnamed protein product [Rotaria sordida]|uniref:EGF-like domain-containing protein n=1 Tax=Rotaria sordida TaxID=392033 RepID=A0A815JX18_9BILA|nr:unnamed protein product [Rotaria sordida]CAF1280158.1 unnamed protein product [Rotaria sordida]CAF1385074.1 unnamed protein product [Rotaria sordida]CAF3726895.1 unnamed protein product [Rotaria sordida]CAF3831928.1 unnamed protein product [Rotaria sordida]
MEASKVCNVCVELHTGRCINETCICHAGFSGIACTDRLTTLIAQISKSQINIAVVIAGILGGALFAVIVSFVVFLIWKRRFKKKLFGMSQSTIATNLSSSIPVEVPALYNISSSRRTSSAPTTTYHLYEELL